MNEVTLSNSLAEAWTARARRARDDYNLAMMAPALFTPEWIARAEAEFTSAMQQAGFWQGQAVTA